MCCSCILSHFMLKSCKRDQRFILCQQEYCVHRTLPQHFRIMLLYQCTVVNEGNKAKGMCSLDSYFGYMLHTIIVTKDMQKAMSLSSAHHCRLILLPLEYVMHIQNSDPGTTGCHSFYIVSCLYPWSAYECLLNGNQSC